MRLLWIGGVLSVVIISTGCSGLVTIYRGSTDAAEVSKEINRVEVPASDRSELRRLADEIRLFLGTPYRWGGTTLEGVDCSGLVQTIYKRVYGISLPRTTRQQYEIGVPLKGSRLRLGDLVFFRLSRRGGVSHVGIYLGEGKFVHASSTRGVLISDLQQKYYRQHFAGARRVLRVQHKRVSDE